MKRKYFLIVLILLAVLPLDRREKHLRELSDSETFYGDSILCAIDLGDDMRGSHGLETGFTYELLNNFAENFNCTIKIIVHNSGENFLDSLATGTLDMLVIHKDTILHLPDNVHLSCNLDDCSVIAIHDGKKSYKIKEVNEWIRHIKIQGDFAAIKARFTGMWNPIKRAENQIITHRISPYDSIIKKYAAELGWDWRLLAAVVYQESKFSINSKSHRGAVGLMQVMPSTAAHYGIGELADPEHNIEAGTKHLMKLQKIWQKRDIEGIELAKFTLASYNAGEGRMLDCWNFARTKGYNQPYWEDIVNIIPLMREDEIIQESSVRLGRFQGYETISYIESIMAHYDAICKIHPSV